MTDDRTEVEHLRVLTAHLVETLEGIRHHAHAMTEAGSVPSISKTAISHFGQVRDECDRALAYARLKQGAMSGSPD